MIFHAFVMSGMTGTTELVVRSNAVSCGDV